MNQSIIDYTLHLADNALVLGHRNSEWCGHGPVLEQDIAITNISLDLIGQARYLFQYAAELKGDGATEDSFAYLRTENDFKNCLLVEMPNGDWGQTILRQFLFSTYQQLLYQGLENSQDEQLAAIAAKSLKEVDYHLRWSSEWVIRLGDGTEDSHNRMLKAIDNTWMYTGELFQAASYELKADSDKLGLNPSVLVDGWNPKVKEVFDEATLPVPADVLQHSGGKEGRHTEHLGKILADLQFMQRTYPGCEW